MTPTTGRQRFRPYEYQEELLQDRSPRRLVLKARQTGLSNTIAIEALHHALNRPDTTILFVSRNQLSARVLISYCQHALGGLAEIPSLTIENQGELGFANGSRIVSLPANPSTGRGFAATRVYLDEFAYAAYDAMIYESVIGTVATGGSMTVLSTPNGRGNMFFRLWAGLEGGDWSRHRIHWSDCPTYRVPGWAEAKRAELSRQSWAQDYECDFIASGLAVFDQNDLSACRDAHNPDPLGCDRYVTGWDIGRRQDHTVGITWGQRGDVWHELAYERFLEPYPVIQRRIEARHHQYGGETWVESNNAGDSVIENLAVSVNPFATTAKSKVAAIEALQLLVQKGRLKFSSAQLERELALYQWDDQNLIQDSVIAAAIVAPRMVQEPMRLSWL